MSYVSLATTTLGSAASSVTFSSIPATYRDLILIITGGISSGDQNVIVSLNGDTTNANYANVQMSGTGSSATGETTGPQTRIVNYYGYMTADLNTVIKTEIFDYAQTNKHKTYLSRANNAGNGVTAVASRWANTSAVTSLAITPGGSTFRSGCTFSLYGVA
jgi:hypothetical protein